MQVNYYEAPIGLIKKTIQAAVNIKKEKMKILFKDGRKFKFRRTAEILRFRDFEANIWKILKIENINSSFAFSLNVTTLEPGWSIYSIQKEFERQKIDFNLFRLFKNQEGSNDWYINSYPPEIIVPIGMTNEEIYECIAYRKSGRMPTLTYYYHETMASLWRCSQPRTGFLNKGSKATEKLFNCIIKSCKKSNDKNVLRILDARPFINAFGNKIRGGGFEIATNYETEENESTLEYQNLENIKVIKDSYETLVTLCNNQEK